ncbi:uncharacterized protein METZ01_LOCUS303490, partial [marine metagenome]
ATALTANRVHPFSHQGSGVESVTDR